MGLHLQKHGPCTGQVSHPAEELPAGGDAACIGCSEIDVCPVGSGTNLHRYLLGEGCPVAQLTFEVAPLKQWQAQRESVIWLPCYRVAMRTSWHAGQANRGPAQSLPSTKA